jgi:hypothetical protein
VNHVTNEYKIREIPFIVSGPGVATQPGPIAPRNVDVARTVLTFMGVPEEAMRDLDGHAMALKPYPAEIARFHQNLIVNGDGEYDRGFDKHTLDQAIGGWQDQQQYPDDGCHTMTLLRYGAPEGYPTKQDPGPEDRGENFFVGGSHGTLSVMTQRRDLSALAEAIDAGNVRCKLSGWLGGFSNQNDGMELTATFQDPDEKELQSVKLPAVTAADRGNKTGLLFREQAGVVPTGTRSVLIELRAIGSTGLNDGYADNLSLVLDPPVNPQGELQ